MLDFTRLPLRGAALTFAALFLNLSSQAQTAPAWVGARSLGSSSQVGSTSAVDAAGNTYELGSFSNSTSVDGTLLTSQGGFDTYLAKYSPAGTLLWVRQLGGTGNDYGFDVAVDAAGNAYVGGSFSATVTLASNLTLASTSTGTKAYVVRYSPQGTPEWAAQSDPASTRLTACTGLATDAQGNVYAAGIYSGTMSLGPAAITSPGGGPAGFLARLSSASGAVQGLIPAYHYAPATGGITFMQPRLAVGPSGEALLHLNFSAAIVFPSGTLTSRGTNDGLVAKYDAQGDFEWVQHFGGAEDDRVSDAAVDAAGNVYLSTSFSTQAQYGSSTLTSAGGTDGCLAKYSPRGSLLWTRPGGGPGVDMLNSVALDAAGNPFVTGFFNGAAQYGPTALTSAGQRDVLVAAYTALGQLRWALGAGGSDVENGISLGLDAGGDLYLTGRHSGTSAFGSFSISAASNSAFIARLATSVLSARAARPLALACYPSPASDQVQLPALPAGTRVQLLDALGRVVRDAPVSAAAALSVRGLAPGLYTLRATDAGGRHYAGRLAVE